MVNYCLELTLEIETEQQGLRQDSKPPCSPMSSKKSLKFIPSSGISLDILETESDALSLVE